MHIGIIGAGQLGQMLGIAARELGYECRFLDPSESPPAASVGDVIHGAYDDRGALQKLAESSDVVTFEFENVPVESLRALLDSVPVYPPPEALANAQDRLAEKRLFDRLQIPRPAFRTVDSLDDLRTAVSALGLPLVLKTRRFGYDGKGQVVIRERSDIDAAWRELEGRASIAETWVEFDTEVSIIGARNTDGEIVVWPLTENEHAGGILRISRAPAACPTVERDARDYAHRLLDHLSYVGVLALELFVVGERLLANEYAPRVHNSGHWTIEGAETSQFTNHLLAITGQALGPTACKGHVGMLNLLGGIPEALRRLPLPGCHLHDYGKAPRPGRKLGHITLVADSAAVRDETLDTIRENVT